MAKRAQEVGQELQPAPGDAQPKPSEARASTFESQRDAEVAAAQRQRQASQPAYQQDEPGVPVDRGDEQKVLDTEGAAPPPPESEEDKKKKKEEEEKKVLEEQNKVKENFEEATVQEGQLKLHHQRPEEEEQKVLKRSHPALDEVSVPKKMETEKTSSGVAGVGGPSAEPYDKEWETEQQRIAEAQRDRDLGRQTAEGVDLKEKERQEAVKMRQLREKVKAEQESQGDEKKEEESPLS